MLYCKKSFSPLQRRFRLLFVATLFATSLLFLCSSHASEIGSATLKPIFSSLAAVPFLIMVALIPRYLARESDEFMRTLVLRALLWGFAVPMVVDTLLGFLGKLAPFDYILPILNIDLFCAAALFALALQVRRYQ